MEVVSGYAALQAIFEARVVGRMPLDVPITAKWFDPARAPEPLDIPVHLHARHPSIPTPPIDRSSRAKLQADGRSRRDCDILSMRGRATRAEERARERFHETLLRAEFRLHRQRVRGLRAAA